MSRIALVMAVTLGSCLVASACSTPADLELARGALNPEPLHLTVGLQHVGSPNILSPVRLYAVVRDAAGEPVPDVEIEWQVQTGGGFVGGWSNLSGPVNVSESAVTVTDEGGGYVMTWGLGPAVGMQSIEARLEGGDPVRIEVKAGPGVVLVGVWKLPEQISLPSDTFRVHATGMTQSELAEARDWIDTGVRTGVRGSYVRRGSGLDTAWIFHLDQAYVKLHRDAWSGIPECIGTPPLTTEELDWYLEQAGLWRTLCPTILEVVDIEEVPDEYLARLNS